MAVSREEIVVTAVRLLDEVGLDGLTLRRLARELGISAPTLYWHIRDKRELLDLVAERIMAEHRAGQPSLSEIADPWERLAESFRRQYRAIIAHRDGARVFAGNRPTEAMLPEIDRWLGFWIELGFSPQDAFISIVGIGSYVTGAALEYEAEMARNSLSARSDTARRVHKNTYPNLDKVFSARKKDGPPVHHIAFEHGLALIIAGLKARHAEIAEKERPAVPVQTDR
jgi:TetR/AcrR family transcriptional regulator, tetracycline repressor protein